MRGHVVEGGTGRPLPRVAVSDGHAVTVSGDDGRWSLDLHDDAEFVFVTVPATHVGLGDFWVDVRHERPDDVEFVLEPRSGPAPTGFRFVHVTDLHVSVDGGEGLRRLQEMGVHPPDGVRVTAAVTEAELAADLGEAVRRATPDFVAATGDLANHGQPGELAAYRRAAAACGAPVAHVPGNHDYLSCLSDETIAEFGRWWDAEGRHRPGADPTLAFQERVFRGDWRAAASGRVPWLDEVGPFYHSFDWGPAHVVVYDSEGLLRYGDDYPQDRWLAADLALVPRGRPVIALLHFVEPASFFSDRFAGVNLVAAFAGHWHTDRVVERDGALHVATPTIGFGGIDHSPRGCRVVDVDSSGVRTRFVPMDAGDEGTLSGPARGSAPATRRGWRADLGGRPALGAPAAVGGRVVVAVETDDGRGGELAAWDAATGAEVWRTACGGAVKHMPAATGDSVVALTCAGALVALGAATGQRRWTAQLGDPSTRWCWGGALLHGDAVFAGTAACFGAYSLADGELRWVRDDLAAEDWMPAPGRPVAAGDAIVVAFRNARAHLCALDARTGRVRWCMRGNELTAPSSGPAAADGVVVTATIDGWLRARDVTTGDDRWRAALDAAWSPATPAVAGGLVVAVSAAGTVLAVHLAGGEPEWARPLGPACRARRSYGRDPSGHLASPVVADGSVWVVTAGGRVVALDPSTGDEQWVDDLATPVSSSPALVDGAVVVATDAGELVSLPRP